MRQAPEGCLCRALKEDADVPKVGTLLEHRERDALQLDLRRVEVSEEVPVARCSRRWIGSRACTAPLLMM